MCISRVVAVTYRDGDMSCLSLEGFISSHCRRPQINRLAVRGKSEALCSRQFCCLRATQTLAFQSGKENTNG